MGRSTARMRKAPGSATPRRGARRPEMASKAVLGAAARRAAREARMDLFWAHEAFEVSLHLDSRCGSPRGRGMFGPLEGPVVSSGVALVRRLSVSPTASCMLSCSPSVMVRGLTSLLTWCRPPPPLPLFFLLSPLDDACSVGSSDPTTPTTLRPTDHPGCACRGSIQTFPLAMGALPPRQPRRYACRRGTLAVPALPFC
eukprot:scaffold4186_cov110-Isochrysis_galbana.AAC.7